MTTKELKHKIIDNIEGIDDENLLQLIKTVLENYNQESLMISDKKRRSLIRQRSK